MLAFLVLILIVLVIVALARISVLNSRIEEARFDLRMLTARVADAERTAGIPAQTGAPTTPPVATEAPVLKPAAQAPPAPSAPPKQLPPKPVAAGPSRTKEEWEALIGGKFLNRIGSLALIIGTGFFLKYAFDRNWISEWVRVLIGVGAGAGLLLGAARSHRRGLQIFAQGLVGAGIAILYLSVYASFNFYQLVSQPVAFGLMGIVTLLTFTQAFKYDSLAVSLLAWLGGFLTPFLLSTGVANAVGLFTYIALLDAGVLAVLLLKPRWGILEPMTLAGTYLIYALWYFGAYTPADFAATVFFLTVFWALFHTVDTARSAFTQEPGTLFQRAFAGANAILYFTALYLVVNLHHHAWMGGTTLALALLFAGTAWLILRKRPEHSLAVTHNGIAAIVLFVLAAEIQFEDFTVVAVYAAQVALLGWLGKSWQTGRISAIVVLYLALLALLATGGAIVALDPAQFRLLINPRAGAFASLAAATGILLLLTRKNGEKRNLRPLLHATWILILFILLTAETSDYFRSLVATSGKDAVATLVFHRSLTHVICWALFALPLVWLGRLQGLRVLVYAGIIITHLAAFAAAVTCNTFVPVASFAVILNIRCAALLLVSGILLWQAWWLRRDNPTPRSEWLHAGWMALLFILLLAETIDGYRVLITGATGEERDVLAFHRLMTIAGVWILYALVLIRSGSRRSIRTLSAAGLGILVLGAAIAALRGLAFDPATAYSPVLNSRAGVLVLSIASLWWTLRSLPADTQLRQWKAELAAGLRIAIIVCSLVLLTGEIRDFYEKSIALLPAGSDEETAKLENLKQLFLSTGWLLYSIGLMALGLWRRTRILRIAAIGLFGVAILKIFVYDLSFLDTLYRIFSFVGLGLILLAVSYLYQRYRNLILE